MRYDTPIFFQKITQGEYDPRKGDYAADTVEEAKVYADVTNAGTDTLKLVYGDIRQDALAIHLQNHYKGTFNRIRVGDKQYRVDFTRKLRVKQILIVREVQ